ncbi:MAG: glycogen synthase [Bacteroidetes bacterium CG12_big_fil_rev_8_21_14_0_65_60_17]|nr:MAG: glycogen synthase [Bacteroidetes bacterium CG12_big_fil_rev_8_21_14_0_65_60_17]
MANPKRILIISGEVAPFSDTSYIASLARHLPEALHETGEYETRIMMPRYATVSERRNRLHEVIRLSGSEITLGDRTETLRVKVASIPGIRLQVYFMDNGHYFKRKGIFADRSGKMFTDNLERAAFFSRSVIRTIRNLGWQPDLVHAFGWMSGYVPYVLRTEFADDPLFRDAKIAYTPQMVDFEDAMSAEDIVSLKLASKDNLKGMSPNRVGMHFADGVIFPAEIAEYAEGHPVFSDDTESQRDQAMDLYNAISPAVPA